MQQGIERSPFSKFVIDLENQHHSPINKITISTFQDDLGRIINNSHQSPELFNAPCQDYPKFTRQHEGGKVCKKLDFNAYPGLKSPGFQYYSPIGHNPTAKKSALFVSPKIQVLFNEMPTEQRMRQDWAQERMEPQEENLYCSEEEAEQQQQNSQQFHSPHKHSVCYQCGSMQRQRRSPISYDENQSPRNDQMNSMSFNHLIQKNQEVSTSKRRTSASKYQHLNYVTLKKPQDSKSNYYKVASEQQQRRKQTHSETGKKKRKSLVMTAAKQQTPTRNIVCNCKKSKCLKLYCDCFAAGQSCSKECNCCGCYNNEEHNDDRDNVIKQILDRNPTAFKSKIESRSVSEDNQRHFKGCNCKKSNCQKKYCECFQNGVKCSELCKCEDCKNVEQVIVSSKKKHDHQMRKRVKYY